MMPTQSPVRRALPRHRRRARTFGPVAILAVGLVASLPMLSAGAAPPVGLGTAGAFAVLAGSGITNTGPTTITGDVGTFPTPTMTGFGTVTLHGTNHGGNAVTQQAKNDLTTAYNTAAGSGPTTAVATELGGRTLTPGVYGGPTLGITGTLTLDTLGDPNAVFIFKAGSTLITASNSAVIVLNGGTACNVFWQVGESATLGTGSHLIGSVLALTSITATTGATVQGRLLARNGAVTLDTNTITRPTCAPPSTTTTTAPTTTTTVGGGGPTTTSPGSTATVPGAVGAPVSGGSTAPGAPSSGGASNPSGPDGAASTPSSGGDTNRTDRSSPPARPGLPVTGADLDVALLGLASLAVGATLVAGARARRRSLG